MVEVLEAEMKNQSTHYSWIVLAMAIFIIVVYAFAIKGFFYEPPEPELPSIIDIQRAVGAKPDGIVGPDTIGKWEAAYANQESSKFMTASGAPRKGENTQ